MTTTNFEGGGKSFGIGNYRARGVRSRGNEMEGLG